MHYLAFEHVATAHTLVKDQRLTRKSLVVHYHYSAGTKLLSQLFKFFDWETVPVPSNNIGTSEHILPSDERKGEMNKEQAIEMIASKIKDDLELNDISPNIHHDTPIIGSKSPIDSMGLVQSVSLIGRES